MDLAPEIRGLRIRGARIRKPDILLDGEPVERFCDRLRGAAIRDVDRRGKYLLLLLDRDRVLQVQLRMTGRFALGRGAPDIADFDHVAAEFDLDDGRTLFYDDVRRLGGFRLLPAEAWEEAASRMGPEPLGPEFTASRFRRILDASRAPVKNLLLDQRRVAGIGNIYGSEALHLAGIDPRRPARSLEPDEADALRGAIRDVLRRALERAGTTFRDYRAVDGRPGRFQESLRVYGREGLACPRCGGGVRRIVQAGRSTFFCPDCQR